MHPRGRRHIPEPHLTGPSRKANADWHVEHLKLDVVDQVLAVPVNDR